MNVCSRLGLSDDKASSNSDTKALPESRAYYRCSSNSPKSTPQYMRMSSEKGSRYLRLFIKSSSTAVSYARTGLSLAERANSA